MTTLTDIQKELSNIGIRVGMLEDGDEGLNVWAQSRDRYPATTVWFHESRTTGNGFVWGDKFQYSAPTTIEPHLVAASIAETLA